jgi:hypothetical protein
MDVDYCFESRLRGFQLVQVPVSLQHEEGRTTRRLSEQQPEILDYIQLNFELFYAKWQPFYPLLAGRDAHRQVQIATMPPGGHSSTASAASVV